MLCYWDCGVYQSQSPGFPKLIQLGSNMGEYLRYNVKVFFKYKALREKIYNCKLWEIKI